MKVSTVMAQLIVFDLDRSVDFYTRLVGRAPDSNPMEGLKQWYLDNAGAIEVSEESERAGQSGVTINVDDLDAEVAALDAARIDHEPAFCGRSLPSGASGSRRRLRLPI